MPGKWSRMEVEAAVSDYREMLAGELRGESFNKAERNRNLRQLLNGRTHGSVERKHQNISAVLIELGYPWVDGYKPLGNFQDLLFDVVGEQMRSDLALLALVQRDASAPIAPRDVPESERLLGALEDPPKTKSYKAYLRRLKRPAFAQPRVNYLELEASNSALGKAGEQWVLSYEEARLRRAGKEGLAGRIEWVSREAGDYFGFDIRSFEENGRDRLIEVKTTNRGKESPFFVTRNEVRVSRERKKAFHLYRVFRFIREPGLYTLAGALDRSCLLDPVEYEARVV